MPATTATTATSILATSVTTEEALVRELNRRSGSMVLTEFHEQVQRVTRKKLSYSHLINMMRGIKPLNNIVLGFLGYERVTTTVFRKIAAK